MQGYPSVREGRNSRFAEEFGLSSANAQKMLTQDHTPSKGGTLEKISAKAGFSPAYWRYGIDPYIEKEVVALRDKAWQAVIDELQSAGRSFDDLPSKILHNFADIMYRHARDNGGAIDSTYLSQILELATDLSSN